MNHESIPTVLVWDAQPSERVAKFSAQGAHYFIGWLISDSSSNPVLQAEFARILEHLEADPTLRYCWRGNEETEAAALATVPNTDFHWHGQLNERAAKLSTLGAHRFIGWLIGVGRSNPLLQAEFARILEHFETDPALRYCWRRNEGMSAVALATVPYTPVLTQEELTELQPSAVGPVQDTPLLTEEEPAIPLEAQSCLADQDPELAEEEPRGRMVEFDRKPTRSTGFPTSILGKIFRRPRLAA